MVSRYRMARIAGCGCPAGFRRKAGQVETAIDDERFKVDFLRREVAARDSHPFRFAGDEKYLWPVQAERDAVLKSMPIFE